MNLTVMGPAATRIVAMLVPLRWMVKSASAVAESAALACMPATSTVARDCVASLPAGSYDHDGMTEIAKRDSCQQEYCIDCRAVS
jgi:hypothetical protein